MRKVPENDTNRTRHRARCHTPDFCAIRQRGAEIQPKNLEKWRHYGFLAILKCAKFPKMLPIVHNIGLVSHAKFQCNPTKGAEIRPENLEKWRHYGFSATLKCAKFPKMIPIVHVIGTGATHQISVQSDKGGPRYGPKTPKNVGHYGFSPILKIFQKSPTGPSTVAVLDLVYPGSFATVGAAVLFSDFSRVGHHGLGVSGNFQQFSPYPISLARRRTSKCKISDLDLDRLGCGVRPQKNGCRPVPPLWKKLAVPILAC